MMDLKCDQNWDKPYNQDTSAHVNTASVGKTKKTCLKIYSKITFKVKLNIQALFLNHFRNIEISTNYHPHL